MTIGNWSFELFPLRSQCFKNSLWFHFSALQHKLECSVHLGLPLCLRAGTEVEGGRDQPTQRLTPMCHPWAFSNLVDYQVVYSVRLCMYNLLHLPSHPSMFPVQKCALILEGMLQWPQSHLEMCLQYIGNLDHPGKQCLFSKSHCLLTVVIFTFILLWCFLAITALPPAAPSLPNDSLLRQMIAITVLFLSACCFVRFVTTDLLGQSNQNRMVCLLIIWCCPAPVCTLHF